MFQNLARNPGDFSLQVFIVMLIVSLAISILAPLSKIWIMVSGVMLVLISVIPWISGHKWVVIAASRIIPGAIPVEIVDFHADHLYTIARVDPKKGLVAPVYWFNNVGECILDDNGLVNDKSNSSYVYFWMPLRKDERVKHLLTNDMPDFSNIDQMEKGQRSVALLNAYRRLNG